MIHETNKQQKYLRVTIKILSRGSVEIQRGVDHTEEERSSDLFSFTSIELDSSRSDGIISEPVSSFVVKVVQVGNMRLLLDHKVDTRHRMIEYNLQNKKHLI
jgi:hypothetical protein